jgi:ADP-ribose pyrophosphatase
MPGEMPDQWNLARVSQLVTPRGGRVLVEDVETEPGGFLRRISRTLRVVGDGLPESAQRPFRYDEVDRRALDAVVVVPHFLDRDSSGQPVRWVILRSAVRPPVLLRSPTRFRGQLAGGEPLWEVPAGLVEPEEETDEGLRDAAVRELDEETGFRIAANALVPLGPPLYPCPGVIAERQYLFAADITGVSQGTPGLDGSPLEALGELVSIPLRSAMSELARLGPVDAKTEVALRRLKELYDQP